MSEHPPFYGKEINRREEQEYVERLLQPFSGRPLTDELRKEVWDTLQWEKHLGNITIPFHLAVRHDPDGLYPDTLEIVLDSKV